MGRVSANKAATSCAGCLAWGVLPGRFCRACYTFAQLHDTSDCASCRRVVALKKGYCRLCWAQASLNARASGVSSGQGAVLTPYLAAIDHHQLFFAGRQRQRKTGPGPRLGKNGGRPTKLRYQLPPLVIPPTETLQLRLFTPVRDFTRFDRHRHVDLENPWLNWARHSARDLAERRGWPTGVLQETDRALVILLSGHVGGERVRYSELFPALRARGLTVERTLEVLTGLDLLADDRVPAFERWLDRKLADLAPGMRTEVEAWLRRLRDGGARARPRAQDTIWAYLNEIQPVLAGWSTRYDHLRQVTRADVIAIADGLQGSKRHHTLSVLRSLFRHAKTTGAVFRDPTARIRVGRQPYGLILPLEPVDLREAVTAAATPAARLALALAAVHAARPKVIRELRLDDVDLGNRRLFIAGQARPLDELTHRALTDWLDYRRSRWPNTANPHLIVSQQSALETGPVSRVWITNALRGLTATLERLRIDRQLEEALTHGPDPLHLAGVFGIDEKTAIRYAAAARELLETPLERDDAG